MHPFLDLQDGPADCRLREITGRPTTVATRCRCLRNATGLQITVRASDPDMLNLIAIAPDGNPAQWVYEEDALQLAIAYEGAAQPAGVLIANPRLALKASGEAANWSVQAELQPDGWVMNIMIPLPSDIKICGLSLHRFFRGIRHEVQGLTDALPHPLHPASFTVLNLNDFDAKAKTPASVVAQTTATDIRFRKLAVAAWDEEEQRRIETARERLRRARPRMDELLDLKAAIAIARERDAVPMESNERFLCWNEAHYQHALLNLWELTADPEWLDRATRRMEQVWDMRSSARGHCDGVWKRSLPTWINDMEGDHTAATLVTGVILGPITRLMRLINDHAELEARRGLITQWLPACTEALDYHNFEWIDFHDGSGMHLEPYSKGPSRVYPRGGSRINPMNRQFFFSMPMLHIARLTGNPDYERKVIANARFFRNHCDQNDECLFWEYEHLGIPATGEDLSHGAAQVAFAELCHAENIVFTERDLHMMANTLQRHIFRHGDVPCGDLRGYHPGLSAAVGMWASLCRFAPHLLPVIRNVIAAGIDAREAIYSARQGWGLRLITSVEIAGRAVAADAE